MKLRNLLFGTMIACVFAACSNEDDPIPSVDPTPTPEAGTADLTIVILQLMRMKRLLIQTMRFSLRD